MTRDDGGAPDGVLRSGEFFTPVVAQERRAPFLLTELHQPGRRNLPRHEHERAYITLVLDGGYSEGTRSGVTDLPPFTAIFNPAGVCHTSAIGGRGTRLFTIEAEPAWLAEMGLRLPGFPVVDRGMGALLWPGISIFRAFKSGVADSLVLESRLVEMLGAVSGSLPVESTAPAWFRRVKEQLDATFRESLRVRDLAFEAGVHPVHLARVFRRQERQTPGDYVQRLRVRAACELLRDRDLSLAGVAQECGFSDQSHFTRTFKRIAGATPGGFRRAIAARQ